MNRLSTLRLEKIRPRRIMVLGLGLLLRAAVSIAAPVVTGTNGTFAPNASISISGSGFQDKSPARPILWADFESGGLTPSSLGTTPQWGQVQSMNWANEGYGGGG